MKLFKTVSLGILGLGVLLTASAQDDNELKLRKVIAGYLRTFSADITDGHLSSVIIRGKQTQGGVDYDFLLRKKEPNFMRIRLSQGDSSVACGYNGTLAWQRTEKDGEVSIEELTGSAFETLRREADFYGPLYRYYEGQGGDLELLPTVEIDGQITYRIIVREVNAPDTLYYIGLGNYRLLRRELLDATGEVVSRTDYTNYRIVDRFPFAFKVVDFVGGEERSVTVFESVEVNAGQLNFYFEKPSY